MQIDSPIPLKEITISIITKNIPEHCRVSGDICRQIEGIKHMYLKLEEDAATIPAKSRWNIPWAVPTCLLEGLYSYCIYIECGSKLITVQGEASKLKDRIRISLPEREVVRQLEF